ncbi:MAG: 23S rRNA (guanosine(2251)-2'-O)-methyltransferase RlmB [Flavobacteriaceae bacterium]|nr:23S rRNA (guanosine(2251)-2'-O)-methyltransferase RlmB [Flavobacteriaceae bacterium]
MTEEKSKQQIFGIHSVNEALLQEETQIESIWLSKNNKSKEYHGIIDLAKKRNIKVSFVPPQKFRKFAHLNHQECIGFISPIKYANLEEETEKSLNNNSTSRFLLLDGVTDVRNLGAIIRTAEASGVACIVLPLNNSAPINNETVKTSSGAVFNIPIVRVNHILDAIYYMQSSGIQIIAATEKANQSIYNTPLEEMPTALIMGDEGKGISKQLMKAVDYSVSLPMLGKTGSLNVSVACGVILYELLRRSL